MKTLFLVKNGQLALLLCGFLCVLDAQAVNWEIDSNLYARGILKDNVYLQVKNEESAKAVSISPNIIFQGRTALSKFDITTLLKQVRYTEDELESREQDEGEFEAVWSRKLEKGTFNLSGSYKKNSSLDETLADAARFEGAIVDIYSGRVAVNWNYSIATNWVLGLGTSYDNVDYDEPRANPQPSLSDARLVNFVNYEQYGVNASLSKALSEKSRLALSLFQLDYDGLSNGMKLSGLGPIIEFNESKTLYDYQVADLTYSYQFSERDRFSLTYGLSRTAIENFIKTRSFLQTTLEEGNFTDFIKLPDTDRSKQGRVYDLTYTTGSETSMYSVLMSKKREADSTGGLVETQKIKLDASVNITERWALISYLLAQKTKAEIAQLTVNAAQSDSDRYTLSIKAKRSMSKLWMLSIEYQYNNFNNSNNADDVAANTIYIGSSWRWNDIF